MSAVMSEPVAIGGGPWGRLSGLVRPWRPWLLLIASLVLAAALLETVPPLLIRWIIDDHLAIGNNDGLPRLALLFLAATGAAQGMTFFYGYLAASVAQRALSVLRVQLFGHLQRMPASYYDRTPLGDVISRCTADIDTLDTVFTSGVATLVANLFRLVTIAGAMIALSPALSVATALAAPPLVLVTHFFQVRVRDAERANRRAVGAMNTQLQEILQGVEVIQAFAREESFMARFRGVLRQVLLAYNRSSLLSSFYVPVTAILSATAIAVLLWVGTGATFGSLGVSIGTLAAFALLLQRFFTPVTALGDEWQTVQSALSGAERIFDVLSLSTDEATSVVSSVQPPGDRGIVCKSVVFGYTADRPVLRGLTFRVAPGEHVALVGRTGAGKTSAVHLLAGLYSPWSGSVSVAGKDPRSISDSDRRRIVGVVPQVVQLFSGTVSENLTLKDDSADESAVFEAARIAKADSFIKGLPDGYQTRLSGGGRGEGVQLSAGQEQLLALARALVWKPTALLLDEATAVLDGASESAFRAALRERVLSTGTAVLTVAHRLSAAREADRVILIDRGRVVEEGSPEELVRQGGRFAALLELEAAGWDWRTQP